MYEENAGLAGGLTELGLPFLALARALVPLYVVSDSDTERLRNTRQLAASLESGELTLRDVFADCRSRNKGTRILLIADQFEEAFALVDDEALLHRFIDVLLAGFPDPTPERSPDICLILTLRADFYGRALRHRPLADALQGRVENLGPMNREELQAAIRRPAEAAKISFEPGLVETLLDNVESKPGSLPLLQFALREIWGRQENSKITRKSYDDIGGVEGALAQRAEAIFATMTENGANPQMAQAFRRLFTRLVTLGEGQEDTRRVVDRRELGEDVWSLAQRLANEDNRLVVTNAPAFSRETAEVVHEALIRHWPKLVRWIDRDRAFQSWLRQITANVELWSADPSDDGPLLRSGMLAQARDWLARRRDDLSATEQSYIEASAAAADAALARSHRAFLATRAAAIVFLIAAVLSGWLYYRAESARRLAAEDLAAAQLNESRFLTSMAETELHNDDPELAALTGLAALPVDIRHPDRPLWLQAVGVLTLARSLDRVRAVLVGHTNWVNSAAWSPDGSRIVTASQDGTARIWNAKSGAPLAVLKGHTGSVNSAAWSPDGTRIATASKDNTARIWDAQSGAPLAVLEGHKDSLNGLLNAAWSPDGTRIATASFDDTVGIWDAQSGALLAVLKEHTRWVNSAAWSPDGTRIATTSRGDDTARIWDAKSGALLAVLKGHTNSVDSAAWSPDGTRLATTSRGDDTARIWDAQSSAPLAVLKGHTNSIDSAAWSPDGSRIVTASQDGTARIWDAQSSAPLAVLKEHTSVVISADQSGAPLAVLKDHTSAVISAAWSPDGTRIATASEDHTARIWDAQSGALLAVLKGRTNSIDSAAWSPDGTRIATTSRGDDTARIWDAQSSAPLAVLKGHTSAVYSADWSPDGTRIATASYDGTARIWDAQSGAPLAVQGNTGLVNSAAAARSPDETRFATASQDNTAGIWDAQSGAPLAMLKGHTGQVISVAWSPDGTRLATTSWDGTARIWDAQSGASLAVLKGHTDQVRSAAWSPDGTRIATTSRDGTARIWDAQNGAPLAVLKGHTGSVNSAAWSPDGLRIATASDDDTARIWEAWPLLTADTLTYASVNALRGLTAAERTQLFLDAARRPAPVHTLSAAASDVTTMSVAQLRAAAAEGNPYAHRQLGELYERGDRVKTNLERALFHHAVEARLFEAAGDERQAQIARARRGSDARALSPKATVRAAYEAMDWRPTAQ